MCEHGEITAALLVGGLGTRLRSVVSSLPKPMATVGDQPFLELLFLQLASQGIHRVVMCTGYLSEEIEKRFGDGRDWNVEITYSKETSPMGTAGALKNAEKYLADSPDFVVMNGDSFFELDLQKLIQFHQESGGLASMAVFLTRNDRRYGAVRIENGRVVGFAEKSFSSEPVYINAGVYVFRRDIFAHIADGPSSLEKDVFPKVLSEGVYALEQRGIFIDIGTPEDFSRAQELSARLRAAARAQSSPSEGPK